MEVIPAIDLRGGRCVRLYQGDYSQETVYFEDPVEAARHWHRLGAHRIHVVDLDGAASGIPANLEVLKRLTTQAGLRLQVGGGIRDLKTAERIIGLGVERVILGTSAVQDPGLVSTLCNRLGSGSVIVGVDAREGKVAVRGWKEITDLSALEVVRRMADLGVKRFIYTDIGRDGTLAGPNFQAIAEMVKETGLAMLASGGISTLEHLTRLSHLRVEGAIVGKALYTGDINLAEAILLVGASTQGAARFKSKM